MDPINQSNLTPKKSKLARTFAKVLHIRSATDKPHKPILVETKHFDENIEKLENKASMDAFVAKLFATLSSVKAAYAELQNAQSPYNPEGIQSADEIIVSELKHLSELKQSFLKKHIDDPMPETTVMLAEIREQKSLVKTYEITKGKLVDQKRVKESEIVKLKHSLVEMERENKLMERRLNASGPLSRYENIQLSKLTPTDFVTALKHAMKSVRSFVKLMVTEMEYANWDIDAAVRSIHPGIMYWNESHKCYAFESFICGEMFIGFSHPGFLSEGGPGPRPGRQTRKHKEQVSFDLFMELKYLKAREYITWKSTSAFAKFCWYKYLQIIHPKMELSLFGNLNQRNLVSAGKYPETAFFEAFAEVCKRVWLLHCLGFSIDPNGVSLFRVRNGCRFSEVFMESVNEEAFMSPESNREVGFTVVPGFKLGSSVVQCQVYVS